MNLDHLSEEQNNVCSRLFDWTSLFFDKGMTSPQRRYIVLAGYAGTGKTYIAASFRKILDDIYGDRIAVGFCTFTGKASSVLAKKLKDQNALYRRDSVGTIHSMIYRAIYEKDKNGNKIFKRWERREEIENIDLIVIDEGSMVNQVMWEDLYSYNIPIIIIGDHGQLPPIGGKFNIMQRPDLILTEIHRQDSDELIILADYIRKTGRSGSYDVWASPNYNVIKMDWRNQNTRDFIADKVPWKDQDQLPNFQMLCGMNQTRVKLNNLARQYKYGSQLIDDPYPGERLVCLKNNNQTRVMNGQMGTLYWNLPADKNYQTMSVKLDDSDEGLYNTLVHMHCFGKVQYGDMWDTIFSKRGKALLKKHDVPEVDVFDFAYAISVHRSQGSEWDKIILFEERNPYQSDDDWRRWLYTAVTRAKQKIVIVTNFS